MDLISPELHIMLVRWCAQRGRSVPAVVSEAVAAYLADAEAGLVRPRREWPRKVGRPPKDRFKI